MASSRNSPSIEELQDPVAVAAAACLNRHVAPGQHAVIGLSGGVDSIALLHTTTALRQARGGNFALSALHVHHGLSPHASHWADFCRETCARLDVPYDCAQVAVERSSRDGLEAAARRARHAAFSVLPADWVLLAHHRDDQAETMLFNLLRGAGLAGAAAMRERNGRLLRPLLAIGRAEIMAYARRQRLDWIEDESNADVRHTRNFLRAHILPALSRRFPAAAKSLAAAATRFAEAQALLDDLARLDLGEAADFPVELGVLARLDEARARNVLRYLLTRHGIMIPSDARLREIVRQLQEAGPDRHPAVVFGTHRLHRRRGRVYLESVAP